MAGRRSEPEAPHPGEVVARRVKELRERRRWSQQRLSERLAEVGHPMHRVTLAKIEQGGARARNVTLEEVLALALAFEVAPLYLFTPLDPDQPVAITETVTARSVDARRWARGRGLIGAPDASPHRSAALEYFAEQPPEELVAMAAQRDMAELAMLAGTQRNEETP